MYFTANCILPEITILFVVASEKNYGRNLVNK